MTTLEAQAYMLKVVENTPGMWACVEILSDPGFMAASGASSSTHEHHCGTGKLAIHTAEVLANALHASSAPDLRPHPDLDILIPATIFHDCEKRRDYQCTPARLVDGPIGVALPAKWGKTEYGKRIYHVAGSYATWTRIGAKHGYSQGFIDAVGHCILAHHGRKEFGSPVEPQTIEALLLHHADGLSAAYGAGR